jgi:hypothetical protein
MGYYFNLLSIITVVYYVYASTNDMAPETLELRDQPCARSSVRMSCTPPASPAIPASFPAMFAEWTRRRSGFPIRDFGKRNLEVFPLHG